MPQDRFNFSPIGWIDTPFTQKFGIPRQSVAFSNAEGLIKFSNHINVTNACRGLQAFSHLWLCFVFNHHIDKKWSDTVRPPRLGGNQKVGVFASRATHRPNPIGLSLVKNEGLNSQNQLVVSGVDLLNKTPILDIKPYLEYSDHATNSKCGYAEEPPTELGTLKFSNDAAKQLVSIREVQDRFESLLISILKQDPRPAYRKTQIPDEHTYHIELYHYDVTFKVMPSNDVTVLNIEKRANLGTR